MNGNNFLKYSSQVSRSIDAWIQTAISLHLHLRGAAHKIEEDEDVDYSLECSMRQWGILPHAPGYQQRSEWAIFDRGMVIDSLKRDHHVVSLSYGSVREDCFRAAFQSPTHFENSPELYSLSDFDKLGALIDIETIATSQVRWLSIPGISCEGVFLKVRHREQIFIPLVVDPRARNFFALENEYRRDYVVEFVHDHGVLPNRG